MKKLQLRQLRQLIKEEIQKIKEEDFDGYYVEDENDRVDLHALFEEAPDKYPYQVILDKLYDPEIYPSNIIKKFIKKFSSKPFVGKSEYLDFEYQFIGDESDVELIKANWISIEDPDIYEKANL